MDLLPQGSKTMVLTEAEALELFAFLAASARIQLDEPSFYASMRLLTAAENLRELVKERVSPDTRGLLDETLELTGHAQINVLDAPVYLTALDDLCRRVAEFLVRQSGLAQEQP